jgi:DNA-binding PadR family transcriptional regulator
MREAHDHHGHHPFDFMRHFRAGRRGHFGFGAHLHGFRSGGRGGIKFEILSVLCEGPRHGYDIMLTIEERTGMRPSPGSIYPALQMLEDEDYVVGKEIDGKRVYTIAEKGSDLLQKRRESHPEGEDAAVPAFVAVMGRGMTALHGARDALKQIARSGNPELIERAVAIIERTRKDLYTILADE